MADLLNNGPSAAQIQSMLQAAQGQGGSGISPLGFRMELNVGSGLSLKSSGINSDAVAKFANPARPGPLGKLLADMGFSRKDILEGMKKVAEGGAVREASQAELFGSGGPQGGFANMVSGSSGPSFEIG